MVFHSDVRTQTGNVPEQGAGGGGVFGHRNEDVTGDCQKKKKKLTEFNCF